MSQTLLRELFDHADWAREKLFDIVAPLSDAQLDQPFEMGSGTIRKTLDHTRAAEKVWLERWKGESTAAYTESPPGTSLASLREKAREEAVQRSDFFNRLSAADLSRIVNFTSKDKVSYALPLDGLMLHVCNHGVYHRAQAVNMVRRVGGALPRRGLDYIFQRLEKMDSPAPKLDLTSLRRYQAYSDWATRKILAESMELPAEKIDRVFEMGIGTLRKTLCHLWDAERWWHTNWTTGPAGAFPAPDDKLSIAEISGHIESSWKARDQFLTTLRDDDLVRPVTTKPTPELTFQFPLGVTMLQLCVHSTLHRAQMMNMLRHVGGQRPGVDLVLWLNESSERSN